MRRNAVRPESLHYTPIWPCLKIAAPTSLVTMQELTIRRPDDWHLHLRDGAALAAVLPHTVRRFARAVIMPNLSPPVTTTAAALAYKERITSSSSPERSSRP